MTRILLLVATLLAAVAAMGRDKTQEKMGRIRAGLYGFTGDDANPNHKLFPQINICSEPNMKGSCTVVANWVEWCHDFAPGDVNKVVGMGNPMKSATTLGTFDCMLFDGPKCGGNILKVNSGKPNNDFGKFSNRVKSIMCKWKYDSSVW